MSFLTLLIDTQHSDGDPEKVHIIVPRSRAYLADLLGKAFEGREDVDIHLDRRLGERRTRREPVVTERRRGERRRPKEEVIEVVIGRVSQLAGPGEGPR